MGDQQRAGFKTQKLHYFHKKSRRFIPVDDPSEDSDGGQSSTSSNNGTTGPSGRRSESIDEPQRPTAAGTTTSFPTAAAVDVSVAAAASIGDNDLHNLNDRLPSSTGKVHKPIAQRAQPFPRAQPQTNMESLFPRSFLPYSYYPPPNTIMVQTQPVGMAEWLRRQTSTQETPNRILHRATHYPPAAHYGVGSGGGGLLRTHSFVPPKVSQSPPTTPPEEVISLPPDVTFKPVTGTVPRTFAISPSTSLSLTSSTSSSSSSSAIVNNSALSASVATTATAVSGHKRARKPKDDDLIPEFSRGELTRNDIVESNIEDFNNKCADKPEEQRTILKDKRRKGKNRIAAKKSRERKINNLKDLRRQKESLKKESRELQNIAFKYQQKKEELTRKRQFLLRKMALIQRKFETQSRIKPMGILVKPHRPT